MASNLKSICDPTSKIVDVTIYKKKIGSYLTNMRPDNCFADPRHVHMIVAKHVVWYLKGTFEYGLICDRDKRICLQEYNDFD